MSLDNASIISFIWEFSTRFKSWAIFSLSGPIFFIGDSFRQERGISPAKLPIFLSRKCLRLFRQHTGSRKFWRRRSKFRMAVRSRTIQSTLDRALCVQEPQLWIRLSQWRPRGFRARGAAPCALRSLLPCPEAFSARFLVCRKICSYFIVFARGVRL